MFRFTIRDVLWLTAIGAVSCVLGLLVAPADPISEILAAALLFVFGGACYAGGIAMGRKSNAEPHLLPAPENARLVAVAFGRLGGGR